MTKLSIKTFLPVFNGFYGTLFEYNGEEYDIMNYNQEHGTDLDWEDFDFDYEEYNNRVAEACCGEIENELSDFGISIKFENIVSPRQYNFSNDSINVTMELTLANYNKLLKYLEDNFEAFEEYIVSKYTSRSGFISHHSNSGQVWMDALKQLNVNQLEHKFGAILEFYFENEGYTDWDLQEAICNENWIEFEVSTVVSKSENYHEYLEDADDPRTYGLNNG